MIRRPFTLVAVVLLLLVAILQLLRFLLGWPVLINGFAVPMWFSGVACVVLAVLAALVTREARA